MLHRTKKTVLRLLVALFAVAFVFAFGLSVASCSKVIEGEQGEQGVQGEQGEKGEKGDKGDTGEKGDTGAQGEKGDTGEQGPQGEQGEKGDTGEQGPQGDQGYSIGYVYIGGDDNEYLVFALNDSDTQDSATIVASIPIADLLGGYETGDTGSGDTGSGESGEYVDNDTTVTGIGLTATTDETTGEITYTLTVALSDGNTLTDACSLNITDLVKAIVGTMDLGTGDAGEGYTGTYVTGVTSEERDGATVITVAYSDGTTDTITIPAAEQIGTYVTDVYVDGNTVYVVYDNGLEKEVFTLPSSSEGGGEAAALDFSAGVYDGKLVIYTGSEISDETSWITWVDISLFELSTGSGSTGDTGSGAGSAEGVYMVSSEIYAAVYNNDDGEGYITRYYLFITYSDGTTEVIYMYYTISSEEDGTLHAPGDMETVCVEHQWSGCADTPMINGTASCLEGYWMAESCTVCGAINIDDMSHWEWQESGEHSWMWTDETYYTLERRTDADGNTAVLFLPEDGTYVFSGYCDLCGARISVSFTLEDAEGYAAEDNSAWVKANASLAGLFAAYGFEFTFEYPEPDGEWDCTTGVACEFGIEITSGYGYEDKAIDFWYGGDGTHTSAELDTFLGEEKVSFTEDSLTGLDLYFTLGESGAVESVYLMDPVYGAVYVYGEPDGYVWKDYNESYDFGTDLGFTFYGAEDTLIDGKTTFADSLKTVNCSSGPVEIGYFKCFTCGTPVPVYASMAHSFDGDGIELERAANAGTNWDTIYSWTEATCTAAASHVSVCLGCGEEILIYGQAKLDHSYSYAIAVDEENNRIEITATCDRCGATTVYDCTLYTAATAGATDTYHMAQNPLNGTVYYEACGEGCAANETKYVLNPEIKGLTVARYAESDVTYDAATGTWTVTGNPCDDPYCPYCSEGAYNVYTLDGGTYSSSIGADFAEDAEDALDCWYVWSTGNVIKLDRAYKGSEYYTIYSSETFGIPGSGYPWTYANYVYADGSDFEVYVRADASGKVVEAYFYDLDGTQMFMDVDYIYNISLSSATCATSFATWISVWCACGVCDGKGASLTINVVEASVPHSFGNESDYLLADGTFDYTTYLMAVAEKAAGETDYLSAWLQFTIEEEPTCAGEGLATVYCTACRTTFKYYIDALEHDYVAEYDPVEDKIVLTCANADVCGTEAVYIDAHFVRIEAATCEELECEVYVGYYEETNRFYQARYETGTEYGNHNIGGIEIETGTPGRAYDPELDTVYYIKTYGDNNEYSMIYTLDEYGDYELLYDTGDPTDPAYGLDDTAITQSDTFDINCGEITDKNQVYVAGSFVCSLCGGTYYVWLKQMHTRPDDSLITTVEATCTEPGYEEYECAVCGELIREALEGSDPAGHAYATDEDGNVVPDKVVLSKDGLTATAYFVCTADGCGHVEEIVLTLSDAVYAGATEEAGGAYAEKNELEAWYWGNEVDCVTAGQAHYTFAVQVANGLTVDGEAVTVDAVAVFDVYTTGGDHVAAEKSFLGVTYIAEDGLFHYMESYVCAVCGQYVIDDYEIFIYDEETAYGGEFGAYAEGFGKAGDTNQVYAYYLDLLENEIEAGAEGYLFYIDYDNFTGLEGGETGVVYYLGYLYTYTVGTGASAKTYTVMFVVEAGEDEDSLESLVDHMGSHHTHEYEYDWGALEKGTDPLDTASYGKVLLWRWIEDNGTGEIQYYARCRYDGQYVRVFSYPDHDIVTSDDFYIVNGEQEEPEPNIAHVPDTSSWTADADGVYSGDYDTILGYLVGFEFTDGGYTVTMGGNVYTYASALANAIRDAGTECTVTLTLETDYIWDDDTTEDKEYTFVIEVPVEPTHVNIPNTSDWTSIDADGAYYGTAETIYGYINGSLDFENGGYTVSIGGTAYDSAEDLVAAMFAGTKYTVELSLNSDCVWEDDTTSAITYTFIKYNALREKPDTDGWTSSADGVYTGSATEMESYLTSLDFENGGYTVTVVGTTGSSTTCNTVDDLVNAIYAAAYNADDKGLDDLSCTVTFTLNDGDAWADGTTDAISYTFLMEGAPVDHDHLVTAPDTSLWVTNSDGAYYGDKDTITNHLENVHGFNYTETAIHYTVTMGGTVYTDADSLEEAMGGLTDYGTAYTVVLTLDPGYAWTDETITARAYTFIVYSSISTVPSTTSWHVDADGCYYGNYNTILGYVEEFFTVVSTRSGYTVTIDGTAYINANYLMEAIVAAVDADGKCTVTLVLNNSNEAWNDGTTGAKEYTFKIT